MVTKIILCDQMAVFISNIVKEKTCNYKYFKVVVYFFFICLKSKLVMIKEKKHDNNYFFVII